MVKGVHPRAVREIGGPKFPGAVVCLGRGHIFGSGEPRRGMKLSLEDLEASCRR